MYFIFGMLWVIFYVLLAKNTDLPIICAREEEENRNSSDPTKRDAQRIIDNMYSKYGTRGVLIISIMVNFLLWPIGMFVIFKTVNKRK